MSEHFFSKKVPDAGLPEQQTGPPEREPAAAGRMPDGARDAARSGNGLPETSFALADAQGAEGAARGAEPSPRSRSRIAQTGRKILDQAKRSLPVSEKPVPRRKTQKPQPPPKHGLAVGLSESEQAQLVEVVDSNDRPLMCVLPATALRQKLALRIVAVALRSRDNRLILHKRCESGLGAPGKWDFYTGFVRVGEAREDAALRLLLSGAGLSGLRLSLLPEDENRKIGSHLFTLFTVDLPAGLYPQHPDQELLMVDADELTGLMRDVPELLSPELIYAAATPGLLKN